MSSTTQLSGVMADRRRRRFRLRLRNVGIIAAAVVLLAGLIYLVGFSPALVVREEVIEGNSLLSADEVSAAAKVPIGTPLIRVSESEIGQRVVGLPQVARVTITRELPGTVRIAVTERVPVLVLGEGDQRQFVSADGATFPFSKTDLSLPRAEVGAGDARLLAEVAVVAGALTPELQEQGTLLTATDSDDITLELDDGPEIFFGSAEQAELKSEVATALLGQDATVIDVSSPGSPATR